MSIVSVAIYFFPRTQSFPQRKVLQPDIKVQLLVTLQPVEN
jgi:hypothetical protein